MVYTVPEIADEMGLSHGRVRALCREHDLGVVKGRDRILTYKEVLKLKRIPRIMGRPKK